MSLDKTQPLDLAELEALRKIAHLVGTIYFYGGFKAETYNERQLEEILKETGYRYRTEDEVLAGAALRSPRPSLDESDRRFLVEILKEEIAHREAQSKREQDGIAGEFHIHRLDHSRRLAAILSEPAPSLVSPPPDREAVARFLASPAKPEQTSPGNLGVTAGEERKIG